MTVSPKFDTFFFFGKVFCKRVARASQARGILQRADKYVVTKYMDY